MQYVGFSGYHLGGLSILDWEVLKGTLPETNIFAPENGCSENRAILFGVPGD